MTLLKKMKKEKITSKIIRRASRYRNAKTLQYCSEEATCFHCRTMLLALHIALICSTTFKLWSGAFQTRTATRSFPWSRNNRYNSPNTGRSQHASSLTTQQSVCSLANGHLEIHGNLLEAGP